jgi:hypothetical protein
MKKFYTDKDIEELFHSGVKSLQVTDKVVLTDLAFEKARMLGMLESDAPPAAPMRPYLSEVKTLHPKGKVDSVASTFTAPARTLTPNPSPEGRGESSLEKRIREKVAAKLGDQVDASLLDTIIKRTLKLVRTK